MRSISLRPASSVDEAVDLELDEVAAGGVGQRQQTRSPARGRWAAPTPETIPRPAFPGFEVDPRICL